VSEVKEENFNSFMSHIGVKYSLPVFRPWGSIEGRSVLFAIEVYTEPRQGHRHLLEPDEQMKWIDPGTVILSKCMLQ
jgi:hypothetical protein